MMPKHCAGLHITLSKETISYSQTDFAKRWGGANLFANDIMLVGLSLDDMVDTIRNRFGKSPVNRSPFTGK